jgi:16S rRNA (guanine527-N7)-methyltransferase
MSLFKNELKEIFCSLGLSKYTDGDIPDKFEALFDMLTETGKVMNLTALTEQRDVIIGHFADSLTVASLIPSGAKVIDVGCGGGFPTLPLAIVRSDISIVALDSTAKKLTFVDSVAKKLSLSVKTLAMRAEDASRLPEYREGFDVCVSRAVARLNILDEICIPFVKKDGLFIAMKGSDADAEYRKAEKGISVLGASLDTFHRITLSDFGARALIVFNKDRETPQKYPRAYAKIKKSPI